MSDDLTARLRRLYVQNGTNYVQEAADVIEKLTAERDAAKAVCARLVAALEWHRGADAVAMLIADSKQENRDE